MVPGRGLEPPRCYPLVPETSASTNSATRAGCGRAAQCTHRVGGCQLKASRGKFGTRRTGKIEREAPRRKSRGSRENPLAPPHAQGRTHAAPGQSAAGAHVKPGAVVEGTVSANRAGFGFVRVEGQGRSVFLPPPEMAGVMHGDRVRVSVERDAATSAGRARVEKVLEHGVKAFLGTLEVQGRSAFVTAADRRLSMRCAVAPADLDGARAWRLGDRAHHALRRLGLAGRRRASPSAWIRKSRWSWPPKRPSRASTCRTSSRPRRCARRKPMAARSIRREAAQRVDLRGLPLVTIDGEDARTSTTRSTPSRMPRASG